MSLRSLRAVPLLAFAALAGCGDGSGIFGLAGSTNSATVRFTNASATPLDLAVNGVVTNPNIAPGTGVGCFSILDPTVPGLSVRQTGTTTDLGGFTPLLSSEGRYTIVAYPGPGGFIQFVTVPNVFIPIAGRSALRVLNVSAGLGVVNVHVTAPGAALSTPAFAGPGFGTASGTFDVPAGTVQVRLIDPITGAVVLNAGNQVLEPGRSYTLIVSGATLPILVPDCI